METLEQFFDRNAVHWDSHHRAVDFNVIEAVFKKISVTVNDTVLDVGAGTGILVPALRQRGCRNFSAVDISEKMVEQYRQKYPDQEVICGDFQKAGHFPGKRFSKILAYNTFPHFTDPAAFFRNAYAHLQKGGLLVIFHSKNRRELDLIHREIGGVVGNHMLISDEQLRSGLKAAGFQDIEIEDNGYYIAQAKK